ncbi:hypothetical protein SAMN04487896_3441 [Paenibacillus sp. ov031]|nr:hypothetical protein SAMN04487896_3441 [Paenibacillus sp. ov031]
MTIGLIILILILRNKTKLTGNDSALYVLNYCREWKEMVL